MKLHSPFILLVIFLCAQASAQDDRPNILLIMADDLGYSDLGSYGGEVITPHLDRLAEQGIRFTNFVNTGKCWSARVSLLTGRYYPESTIHGPERNSVTIAEVLGADGYQTWAVGKWHQRAHPLDAGFERFIGHLNKGTPPRLTGNDSFRVDREPFDDFGEDWWATEYYADNIIGLLEERDADKPFFLYFGADAPHWPFQSRKEDTEPYLNIYKRGWDSLRNERFQRQIEMGLAGPNWSLPARPDDVVSWWNTPREEKEAHVLAMAGYAGSITGLDRQLARVFETLETKGLMDNTLIIFLSDNGACALNFTREETRSNLTPPWEPESFWACGPEWAHLSNTPFRLYKGDMHEGGIASPMIVHWPAGIAVAPGSFVRERTHIVDILATCLDAADAAYPEAWAGADIAPHRGVSLLRPVREEPWIAKGEYWNGLYSSNGFVRWPWKLSRSPDEDFSLYNLKLDRAETMDLKERYPETFFDLRQRFIEVDSALSAAETDRNFSRFKDRNP